MAKCTKQTISVLFRCHISCWYRSVPATEQLGGLPSKFWSTVEQGNSRCSSSPTMHVMPYAHEPLQSEENPVGTGQCLRQNNWGNCQANFGVLLSKGIVGARHPL
jgi:hypothetical protein